MSNKEKWFSWGREKQRLMSEVVENARKAVEAKTKKELNWAEFSPKNSDDTPILNKVDVLEALGVDLELKEDNTSRPRGILLQNGAIKWTWPTNVPGLNFIRIRNSGASNYDDYFEVESLIGKEIEHKDKPKKESHSQWNKRMWDHSDADKKANQELTAEFGEKPSK